MISTTQFITILLWTGAITVAWLLLTLGRQTDNRRPPIVGVQKHGRTLFVRRDTLDDTEMPSQWDRSTPPDWLGRNHQYADKRGTRPGSRSRVIDRMILVLTVLASLIAGTVLLSQ